MGEGEDVRKLLDTLYTAAGGLSAALVAGICLLVTAQVMLNLATRIATFAGLSFNATIPSYASISGYMLAAASFFALSYTLMQGGHIRVTLLLQALGSRARLGAEILSLAIALFLAAFATYYMGELVHQSWRFGDLSTGILALPLWIPQSAVLAGLVLLTIALVDLIVRTLQAGGTVLPEGAAE